MHISSNVWFGVFQDNGNLFATDDEEISFKTTPKETQTLSIGQWLEAANLSKTAKYEKSLTILASFDFSRAASNL